MEAQNNSGPFVRLKNAKALGHSLQNINTLPVKQTVIIWHTNNHLTITIILQIYFKPDSCVLKYAYFISEHIKNFLKNYLNRMVYFQTEEKKSPLSIHLIFIPTAFSNTRVLKNSWLCYALLNSIFQVIHNKMECWGKIMLLWRKTSHIILKDTMKWMATYLEWFHFNEKETL